MLRVTKTLRQLMLQKHQSLPDVDSCSCCLNFKVGLKHVRWMKGERTIRESVLFLLPEVEVSLDHLPHMFGFFICQTGQVQFTLHGPETQELINNQ